MRTAGRDRPDSLSPGPADCQPRAAPSAWEIVPSIPAAPRAASTVIGSGRGPVKVSMSRTAMLFATQIRPRRSPIASITASDTHAEVADPSWEGLSSARRRTSAARSAAADQRCRQAEAAARRDACDGWASCASAPSWSASGESDAGDSMPRRSASDGSEPGDSASGSSASSLSASPAHSASGSTSKRSVARRAGSSQAPSGSTTTVCASGKRARTSLTVRHVKLAPMRRMRSGAFSGSSDQAESRMNAS